MSELFWFGITVRFTCQLCKQVSIERIAMSNIRSDVQPLIEELHKQTLTCQKCKLPIVIGTDVEIFGLPGRPEQLKQKGFPVPLDALSPAPDKQN